MAKNTDIQAQKLIRERTALMTELETLGSLIHGSWIERYTTCSRKDCTCHKGKKHGPRHYVVITVEGKQRQKYVPVAQVAAVKFGIEQGRRADQIIRRVTVINLELARLGVLHVE